MLEIVAIQNSNDNLQAPGLSFASPLYPFEGQCGGEKLSIAYEGRLVNGALLQKQLPYNTHGIMRGVELLARLIEQCAAEKGLLQGVVAMLQRLSGSYTLVALCGDTLIAARSFEGSQPLTVGISEDITVVASKESSLALHGAAHGYDLKPGDLFFSKLGNPPIWAVPNRPIEGARGRKRHTF